MSAALSLIIMDSNSFGHRLRMEKIIKPFIDCQFKISKLDFDNQVLSWDEYEKASEEEVNQLLNNHQFHFYAYHDLMRFETHTQVGWGEELLGKNGRVWINVSTDNTPYFWHIEYEPIRYSNFFLNLTVILYNELLPRFGWIDFDHGPETTFEDVEEVRLTAIYWATFFGRKFAQKIGRT